MSDSLEYAFEDKFTQQKELTSPEGIIENDLSSLSQNRV